MPLQLYAFGGQLYRGDRAAPELRRRDPAAHDCHTEPVGGTLHRRGSVTEQEGAGREFATGTKYAVVLESRLGLLPSTLTHPLLLLEEVLWCRSVYGVFLTTPGRWLRPDLCYKLNAGNRIDDRGVVHTYRRQEHIQTEGAWHTEQKK